MLSAAVLLTTLMGVIAALFLSPKPAPALLGMECVVAMAAAMGLMFWRGRWHNAPAMTLACVAGTILAGSVFGYFGVNGTIGGYSLKPYVGFRALAAVAIAGAGCLCVLIRDKRSWPVFLKGALCAAPAAAIAMVLAVPRGRSLLAPVLNGGLLVQMVVVVGGFLLWAGLLSAGVHLIIKAFEFGRLERDPVPPKKASPGNKGKLKPKAAPVSRPPASAPVSGSQAPAATAGSGPG